MVYDKDSALYWHTISVKDILSITAVPTGVTDFTVINTFDISVENIEDWRFIQATNALDYEIWLVIRLVEGESLISLHEKVSGFVSGNREDMINQGDDWLFTPPSDLSNYQIIYLNYAKELRQGDIFFPQKTYGEVHGKCFMYPDLGNTELMATISEYYTEQDVLEKEVIILEVGMADSNLGGYIQLFHGNPISPVGVEVHKVGKVH